MIQKRNLGEEWNKARVDKCINVIKTKEAAFFDEVCMIATFSTYDDNDLERCERDEVVLCMEFPGYDPELSYIKYGELLELIEYGIKYIIKYKNHKFVKV